MKLFPKNFRSVSSVLDAFIELLKWPVAIFLLLIMWPALKADMFILSKTFSETKMLLEFFLPLGAVTILFVVIPSLSGSFFAIMEHELTHMLFAVLTFHKPQGIEVDQDYGGSFSFVGKGNWLIAIAPYFFPTFLALIMVLTPVYLSFEKTLPNFYLSLLGIFTGYNLATTLLSIHAKQTDFQVVGFPFAICFIPGATLLKYGFLLCFAIKGWEGFPLYIKLLGQMIVTIFKNF